MAMSDTCYETLGSLSSDFMHYIDWGYDGKDLSLVVDSMYNLVKFGVLHDNFDRPTDEWLAEAAHRVVISSLLEDMEIGNVDVACEQIASIAKHNVSLAEGIEYLAKCLKQKGSLFDSITEPLLNERLTKIAEHYTKQ